METVHTIHTTPNVPMLCLDGGNWPVFKNKLEDHLEGLGLVAHFDLTKYPVSDYNQIEQKPEQTSGETKNDFDKRMEVWKEGEAKWMEGVSTWKKDGAKARTALGKVLPNSMYVEVAKRGRTFHQMWSEIETRIERITKHQRSNLKGQLNQIKCGERDNVHTHLNNMESIYQQLSTRGATISDEDYVDAIIRSMPHSYQNLLSSLLTIYDEMGRTITPETIKSKIRTEYDACQTSPLNQQKRQNETALQADTRFRGRG